jgi:hypothetical protein
MDKKRVMRDNEGMKKVGKSKDNALQNVAVYVHECLRRIGKYDKQCELCGRCFNKRLTIHHKKYDGATIYDLCYACQRCQSQTENRYLD